MVLASEQCEEVCVRVASRTGCDSVAPHGFLSLRPGKGRGSVMSQREAEVAAGFFSLKKRQMKLLQGEKWVSFGPQEEAKE